MECFVGFYKILAQSIFSLKLLQLVLNVLRKIRLSKFFSAKEFAMFYGILHPQTEI